MSRHHRKTSTREWERIRGKVFARDGRRCRKCKKAGRLEAHHVVQLAQGGTNDMGNLMTLCRDCHMRHHEQDTPINQVPGSRDWRPMIEELSNGI